MLRHPPPAGSVAEELLVDILMHSRHHAGQRARSRALLCGPERHAALLICILALANQANGSSTVLNYLPVVLRSPGLGFSAEAAGVLSLCTCMACSNMHPLHVYTCASG